MSKLLLKVRNELNKYDTIKDKLILDEDQASHLVNLGFELKSKTSLESIALDPYWPKWDSPWWKALLLYEIGCKHLIPKAFLDHLLKVIDSHYLHTFPLVETDIPENCDPYRHILCFCALGNMYKLLEDSGYDVKISLPWWYAWLEKYQLPNGGYNCDESVYTSSMKASFLSTLPMLEAMLIVFRKTKDPHIKTLLDKGALYLLQRGLYKTSKLQIINKGWHQPSFPRYYDYDVLHGLTFIADWATQTGAELPEGIISDSIDQISLAVNTDGYIVPMVIKLKGEGSLFYVKEQSVVTPVAPVAPPLGGCIENPQSISTYQWIWSDKSASFPALDLFSNSNDVSIPLTLEWYKTLEKLVKVKFI